ncbi:hypothetical protein AGDE_16077 [Angomonas deanei]|uniref:Uncharacterized protein n=1 Tax=Angomonas deanei TaxID=59799 RepID=A0A7G2C3S5_9TRYP|nr:hypothetical protein AGDE_16077 [Angomonas deanei]CAD2213924.1 hypothetical protein, conserved [Angomonas deanei]|eukprot:EPY17769.1 hypothetical protein AGDE_16077 [Angomonas deanei]
MKKKAAEYEEEYEEPEMEEPSLDDVTAIMKSMQKSSKPKEKAKIEARLKKGKIVPKKKVYIKLSPKKKKLPKKKKTKTVAAVTEVDLDDDGEEPWFAKVTEKAGKILEF